MKQRMVLATAVLLLAGGCTGDQAGDAGEEASLPNDQATGAAPQTEPATSTSTQGATDATESGASPSETTTGDSEAGVAERSDDVLVEQTVAMPDSPNDETRIGVQSLTVEGDTMVLRLVITPDFSSASNADALRVAEAVGHPGEFFGTRLRLLDRENLKEYSVIHISTDWWASTEVKAQNGEPMHAFAVFAAPEDDIDTVDVRIDDNWPEFTDVPITR